MPHLQFDINKTVSDIEKQIIASEVRTLFAEVMETGMDHIAVSIREFGTYNLSIGRVEKPEKGVALINADIRSGRTLQQRRDLALGFMTIINTTLAIPQQHIYVTLTEHKGEDFHLSEKFLASWQQGEDPLAD
ncbi:MAG: tautomerase [gamma proteobacterium symbiont of Ctena orbiculata]|uniref:Tautomerase n=1 Tax=Candidatus Thiodiazotropha taylori TaxID=2792791 RepID=A0A944QTU6_9GAMM|nr:tautomerase [Candidatus Thiodiazotropha taylori]PUB82971.1 MAG: tautomerase [gamma proteobacterium symbiont of Ctena orbiculata]MBT2990318.1 tautomerase [Candidatus Thiodiazotropha taylori]MBT2998246.1 tautomerase [Candidatus Thiodiazotropha taylori]MBT3002544.1 tautomerase [Candidatus Thiodiazotropha taylori]